MLYEMATGERPFKGDTNVAVLSSILRDTPPARSTDLKPGSAARLWRIVRRCLAKDPEALSDGQGSAQRFACAEERSRVRRGGCRTFGRSRGVRLAAGAPSKPAADRGRCARRRGTSGVGIVVQPWPIRFGQAAIRFHQAGGAYHHWDRRLGGDFT